jgi:ligand-binding sensor domain-containing protein
LPLNSTIFSLVINPITSDILYAGTSLGVFKSSNGGVTWESVGTSLTGQQILQLTSNSSGNILYAGTSEDMYKSVNGGGGWQLLTNDLPAVNVNAIISDAQNTLYLGTARGIFRSKNGGANWATLNVGLTNPGVLALATDPAQPDTFYTGTAGSGVFTLTEVPSLFVPLIFKN